MSVSAASLRALATAGASAEMIVALMEAEEAAEEAKRASRRAAATERKRRQRAREAQAAAADVAHVTRDEAGQRVTERDTPTLSPSLPLPPNPQPPPTHTPAPTGDTREAPEPLPPPRKAKPEHRELLERIWSAQPLRDGKRRATRPDVAKALAAALARGADPADVERGCLAYYALPASRKEGGEYAMGAARLLECDRWREFLPMVSTPTTRAPWQGPADVRAAIAAYMGEDWTACWIDRCGWRDLPQPTILAFSPLARERIEREVGHRLREAGVGLELAQDAA